MSFKKYFLLDKFDSIPKNEIVYQKKWENESTCNITSDGTEPLSTGNLWVWFLCGGMGLFFVVTWVVLGASIAKMVRLIKRKQQTDMRTVSSTMQSKSMKL